MTLKKNKVAWITGGGTGIGKELALILAKQEYDVIISGRRKEKLIETANVNKKKIHPISLNVNNPNQCLKVSKSIYKKFKDIDLLILNAAIYSPGSITKISITDAKKVIDINLLGAINCLSPVAKVMQKNKVLNSQDCSYINFEIKYLGDEMIYDNSLRASRYKLLGKEFTGDDVNIDIWYKDKKWVKMSFLKDGSTIEYFLKEYDSKKE